MFLIPSFCKYKNNADGTHMLCQLSPTYQMYLEKIQ